MNKILLLPLLLIFVFAHTSFAQSTSTVKTKVGNPTSTEACWPTTGTVTQGPMGVTSHARIQSVGGGQAMDIANGRGTPIYATYDGLLQTYDCTNRGECDKTYGSLGNYAKLTPDAKPNAIILFGHMVSISAPSSGRIHAGDLIGLIGDSGADPGAFHLHYEFRGMPLTTPNIPQDISPLSCDGACSPSSVSQSSCSKLSTILPTTGRLLTFTHYDK